jgi:tetratricopeptide (TPR) repeat protein
MSETLELHRPKMGGTENMIYEYAEKVTQAIEMESNKIREKAEQDSLLILAEARAEADRIISQAKQEAKAESDKLIAQFKKHGEQILRESREKALVEARQESARIINATRDKSAQLINEFIAKDVTQVKKNFVQAAAASKRRLESEKSKLFAITKNIEHIFDESGTNMLAEIEHLNTLMAETEEKLRTISDIPHREIVTDELKLTDEAGITGPAEKIKQEETEMSAGQEPEVETGEAKGTESSNYPDQRMQEGIDLLESGRYQQALEVFMEIIDLYPDNGLTWRKKGAALGKLGRYNEALEAFSKAIELDPNDVIAWHNKVLALANLGRKEEAREAEAAEKRARLEKEFATKI